MDSMIRRIVLKNFMSHEFTVIEPVAGTDRAQSKNSGASSSSQTNGLTVLIGDNNSGKSAIVSALQTVAQNASGDFMVRHGEKECEVIIETCECGQCFDKNKPPKSEDDFRTEDDQPYVAECPTGNVLIWRRIKNKTSYVVNGRVVDRLRGSVPDDLHDLLRMPLVMTPRENTFFDVHFGEQKSPIFLLGDKATDRAAFFASSSDTAKLIEMQQRHRTKIKEANSQRKLKLAEQSKLDRRLTALEPLYDLESAIEKAEAQFVRIQQQQTANRALRDLISAFESAKKRCDKYSAICQSLQGVQRPPDVPSTENLKRLIEQLDEQTQTLKISKARNQILSNCKSMPQIESTVPLSQLIDQLANLKQSKSHAQSMLQVLSNIWELQHDNESALKTQLHSMIESLSAARSAVENEKKKVINHEVESAEAESALRENFEQLDNCPTCGQSIDIETALATAHIEANPNDDGRDKSSEGQS